MMIVVMAAVGAAGISALWFWFDWLEHQAHVRILTVKTNEHEASLEWGKILITWWNRAARRAAFERELPDFFDLLALGLSAGLPFDKAMELSVRLLPNGFFQEQMERMLKRTRMGGSFESTLTQLGESFSSGEITGAFALIRQSIRAGNPLQDILFDQASALRRARMNNLEKKAQTIGLRLLFPIVFFIFPTVFVLLFGMLYLSFIKNGSLF